MTTSKEQVGAHHCTSEAIAALLADLDAIGECRESPPLQDRDHRAMAGVVACVIRHLQGVGVRLAVEKFNLKGELRETQSANRALPHRQSRPVPRAWAGNVDDAALHDLQINRPGALHVVTNGETEPHGWAVFDKHGSLKTHVDFDAPGNLRKWVSDGDQILAVRVVACGPKNWRTAEKSEALP